MAQYPNSIQFTIPIVSSDVHMRIAQMHSALSYDFFVPVAGPLVPADSYLATERTAVCHSNTSFVPALPFEFVSSPISNSSEQPSLPPLRCIRPSGITPSSRRRSPDRPPRPRNAFMIYRSEIWAKEKITKTVEHDHRHISRIIGHCWNQMPEEEKNIWRRRAEQEKLEHERKYPGYRFTPGMRLKKPVKRNVKRNSEEELDRCKKVASLLLAGKTGDELESAVKTICPIPSEAKRTHEHWHRRRNRAKVESSTYEQNTSTPPFRSPLLVPSNSQNFENVSTEMPMHKDQGIVVELQPGSTIPENSGHHLNSGHSIPLTLPLPSPRPSITHSSPASSLMISAYPEDATFSTSPSDTPPHLISIVDENSDALAYPPLEDPFTYLYHFNHPIPINTSAGVYPHEQAIEPLYLHELYLQDFSQSCITPNYPGQYDVVDHFQRNQATLVAVGSNAFIAETTHHVRWDMLGFQAHEQY